MATPEGTAACTVANETASLWSAANALRHSGDPLERHIALMTLSVLCRHASTERVRGLARREVGRVSTNPRLFVPRPA